MLKEEIAETIHDSKELENIILKLIGNKAELEKKKKKAKQIIKENKGAVEIVWNEIQKLM
jgi:3-deoxy-D-manno-octulosonic-acid transferase